MPRHAAEPMERGHVPRARRRGGHDVDPQPERGVREDAVPPGAAHLPRGGPHRAPHGHGGHGRAGQGLGRPNVPAHPLVLQPPPRGVRRHIAAGAAGGGGAPQSVHLAGRAHLQAEGSLHDAPPRDRCVHQPAVLPIRGRAGGRPFRGGVHDDRPRGGRAQLRFVRGQPVRDPQAEAREGGAQAAGQATAGHDRHGPHLDRAGPAADAGGAEGAGGGLQASQR
mmetsp:Transcript_39122/g.124532  ORF Transcript_39122/g.124532 Transcript_39122/m.124532 type:complete len:223 (-) Transcript_39122:270-938(-)